MVTSHYLYERKPRRVWAIQWTGRNWPAVQQFLADIVGEDCGPRLEDDGDNVVQFYAWGDDQEVDVGRWIVAYPPEGRDGEILTEREFRGTYRQYQVVPND